MRGEGQVCKGEVDRAGQAKLRPGGIVLILRFCNSCAFALEDSGNVSRLNGPSFPNVAALAPLPLPVCMCMSDYMCLSLFIPLGVSFLVFLFRSLYVSLHVWE